MKPAFLFLLALCLCGCATVQTDSVPPSARAKALLDAGKYHEAVLFWSDKPMRGPDSKPWWDIMKETAKYGSKEWIAIYSDPTIPMGLKYDLHFEIHACTIDGYHENFVNESEDWEMPAPINPDLERKLLEYLTNEFISEEKKAELLANYETIEREYANGVLSFMFMEPYAEALYYICTESDESRILWGLSTTCFPAGIKAHLIPMLMIRAEFVKRSD